MKFVNFLLVVVLAFFASFSDASAFELKHTPGGAVVHWPQASARILVNSDWPREYRGPDFPAEVFAAYEVWNNIPCSDFVYLPDGQSPAKTNRRDHQNLVIFSDQVWSGPSGTLATTLLAYNTQSGEILDADTLVNGVEFSYSKRGAGPLSGEYDLSSVLTHEAGHALGLGHVSAAEPVMHSGLASGEKKRRLSEDDRLGVCELYPLEPHEPGGCSCWVAPPVRFSDPFAILGGFLALFWLFRFRK